MCIVRFSDRRQLMAKKKQENYLDYVPAISDKHTWSVEGDKVTIHMEHRGFYAWIAQKFFSRPRVSHIDLDQHGSFIFRQINGERTVGELAQLMKAEFGDETSSSLEIMFDDLKTPAEKDAVLQKLESLKYAESVDYKSEADDEEQYYNKGKYTPKECLVPRLP